MAKEQRQQKFNVLGLSSFKTKAVDSGIETVASNRLEYDPFASFYAVGGLVEPPFQFYSLYTLYEQSDVLRSCIAAMQKNVDGFGYRLDFLGDDLTQKDSAEAKAEYENIIKFFDEPNIDQPFRALRTEFRKDFEVLGQGAFEVVRFRSGGISALYYLPMIDLRMSPLDEDPVTIQTTLWREGKAKRVNVKKRFRKFAQTLSAGWSSGNDTIRWFKELGDPRIMDATTGNYVSSRKEAKEVATEVLLIQQPTNGRTYAIPRWIANVTDIRGRSNVQYINYDIGETQGIPPMLLLVQNGMLSDESREELRLWAESMRGPENFNRIALLEATPELQGLDDKGQVQVKLENLMGYRSNDLMFDKYLESTEKLIRQAFRLPGMYLGDMGQSSYANSYISQKVSESQVFMPEREYFDDIINHKIIKGELKSSLWKYTSCGPQIVSSEELRLSLKEFVAAGAVSINNAISLMNEMFGLSISQYSEEWANMPVALLKVMTNNQSFVLEDVVNNLPAGSPQAPAKNPGAPATTGAPNVPPITQPTQLA